MKSKASTRSNSKGLAKRRGTKKKSIPPNTIALVRIGNSRGVRLPKTVIEQACLGDRVELVVGNHEIILKSLLHPRSGWDAMMRKAIAEEGSPLTDEDREWLDAPIDATLDDE
jgi:antitoxin MazE